jgi:hypothetical protein
MTARGFSIGLVLGIAFLSLHCSPDEGSGGDGDGDGDGGDGDGDLGPGSGGNAPGSGGNGSTSGGNSSASGGNGAESGGTAGDGDGDAAGGSTGDGDGDTGCVVDLDCEPEPLPPTGDFAQDCVNRINQFRVDCHCLDPLARWSEAEVCAAANAEYDQGTGQAHSGWPDEACPDESGPLATSNAGWATNECPSYGSATSVINGCLQSMYAEGAEWAEQLGRAPTQSDYGSCENSCYSAYGHFIAMTNANYSMVACGIYDEVSDDIWSVQNFQ